MKPVLILLAVLSIMSCQQQPTPALADLLKNERSLHGKSEYLQTPYVTAGDRVYAVGHQDGSFPDMGWHVPGEMGGIWDHPIKLMDGFTLGLSTGERYYCLNEAEKFINYPMANQHFFLPREDLSITRTQFVPDNTEGLIIEFLLENSGATTLELSLDLAGMIDLRPVWLAERLEVSDGKDLGEFDRKRGAWVARDSLNDWFVVFGTEGEVSSWQKFATDCSYQRKGLGLDLIIQSKVAIPAGKNKVVRYFIAGSYRTQDEALKTYDRLKKDPNGLLTAKINRYADIQRTANLTIPDKGIEEMYTWTKFNTDWLMREVPEIGRGLSAGIPDYPWWFGTDNTYSLQGLLATGQHEEVKATMQLILDLSRHVNDNGRIMHEASTNGVVFNPGNLNTTPYFIHLLWKYYQWTGDRDFLENAFPDVKKGLAWLEGQDKDGNGYADGAGMMEIHGLHSEMIDVVSYSYAAYEAAAKMAEIFHEHEAQERYADKAKWLAKKINSEWWVDRAGSFADFRASRVETLQLIDAAIVRADTINKPWAVEELETLKTQTGKTRDNRVEGHVVHHNWVVNTPLEVGVATPQNAQTALKTARKYTNRFGMYVTGIDRAENQEAASKWKAFSYVGAVMTLPTGVQAISEARYGNPDRALEYLKMLDNGFSFALPGSMYEVSPDYGMIAQAWNIYAVATPIIEHFFGVAPNAPGRKVNFRPNMPTGWEEVKLENLIVGDNKLSFEKTKTGYLITQSQPDWTIELIIPDPGQDFTVNGERAEKIERENGLLKISMGGEKNEVLL